MAEARGEVIKVGRLCERYIIILEDREGSLALRSAISNTEVKGWTRLNWEYGSVETSVHTLPGSTRDVGIHGRKRGSQEGWSRALHLNFNVLFVIEDGA